MEDKRGLEENQKMNKNVSRGFDSFYYKDVLQQSKNIKFDIQIFVRGILFYSYVKLNVT